ncbi:hypothetical protein BH10PSE18_BH10PSE18_37400 [soil metagenome]
MKPTMQMLAAAAVMFLAGCASTPDRYYTLASLAETPKAAEGGTLPRAASPLFLELAPLAVPERLARPQMVVRKAGAQSAEVELLEQSRWASSFENELRDALAAGIASRLGAVDLTRGGPVPAQPVWRIAVQVRQFDAVRDTRVDATFSWSVRRSDGDRVPACEWSGSESVGNGIEARAQGAQRLTAKAAEAIARRVSALQADPAAACAG